MLSSTTTTTKSSLPYTQQVPLLTSVFVEVLPALFGWKAHNLTRLHNIPSSSQTNISTIHAAYPIQPVAQSRSLKPHNDTNIQNTRQ